MNRTLHDIAHLLESAERADERIARVLELMSVLVPYEQCAVLEARVGCEPNIVAAPGVPAGERSLVTARLLELFGRLVDSAPAADATPRDHAQLAVPMVGLGELIGLLWVRSSSSVVHFTEQHLRVLSIVASQLAAYFTTLQARDELLELGRERDLARRAAEAANRAKDEFLALVSHELKTPLTSVLAWTHVLRSTTGAAESAHAIDEIERGVREQSKLVDDILDLASIAAAELRLNLRPIEPVSLIKASIGELQLEALRKSVRLESDLDTDPMPVLLDPDRMSQVIRTLIQSAIHFTPAGGRVEISLKRADAYVRMRVCHGGGAIVPDALPVFDRFPAGELVENLVALHGGRVRADGTDPARGEAITIELPRVPASQPARGGEPDQPTDGRLLAGVRALLVDDDASLRASFQLVLEDCGAHVMAVGSAREALAALEGWKPDVLLFGDLAQRGESVDALMREVTARLCPLPVASISAWRVEKERALAAGFRLHLTKPLEISALVEAVALLAGRSRGALN